MTSGNFTVHDHAVLRIPRYPLESLNRCMDDGTVESYLAALSKDPSFRESILLSSKELYDVVSATPDLRSADDNVKFGLFKYAVRSSSQPTPFGMLASYSFLKLQPSKNTERLKITVGAEEHLKRHARIDSGLYFSLLQDVEDLSGLMLFSNPTIFVHDGKIKYVERKIVQDFFDYSLSRIEAEEELIEIIEHAKRGASFDSLADLCCRLTTMSPADAKQLIADMVKNFLLLTELELSTVNDDVSSFDRQLSLLAKHTANANVDQLSHQVRKITAADQAVEVSLLDSYACFPTQKNVVQVDLENKVLSHSVPQDLLSELTECVDLLTAINRKPLREIERKFIKTFRDRYDRRQVPLLEVFDPEIGIDFENLFDNDDDLLHGIAFRPRSADDRVDQLIDEIKTKFLNAKQKGDILHLKDLISLNDLPSQGNKEIIPPSFSVIVQLFGNDEYRLQLFSIGQISAVNLINRFGNGTNNRAIQDISDHEKRYFDDVLIADIDHISTSPRAANVMIRPAIWDYRISYFNNSVAGKNNIDLSDLYVSLSQSDEIRLSSGLFGKQVMPRISNAVNAQSQSNPLYRFFSMVQDQQFTPTIGIPWLLNGLHLPYLQRIVYKHIIVSPATWLFKSDALREIADQASAKRWAASAQLPDRFSVQGKDGTCTIIDLNSSASVKMFLRMTAGDQDIVIQEFLFDQLGSAVKDDRGGEYLNQLIFSFMKTIPARSHA